MSPVTSSFSKPARDEFCRANILLSGTRVLAATSDYCFIREFFLGKDGTTTILEHCITWLVMQS